jgi:hypothetical protein
VVRGRRRGGREVRRGAQDSAVSGCSGRGGRGECHLGQGGGVFDCSDEELEIQSHGFWGGSEQRAERRHGQTSTGNSCYIMDG